MNPVDVNRIIDALRGIAEAQRKGGWDFVNTIAVVLTLLVVIWYTSETASLRRATSKLLAQAELQNEIAVAPMLSVYTGSLNDGIGERIFLENIGSGPALNISIEVSQPNEGKLNVSLPPSVMKVGNPTILVLFYNAVSLDTNELMYKIMANAFPGPLTITVGCVSLHSKRYTFCFNCTVRGYAQRLQIVFDV